MKFFYREGDQMLQEILSDYAGLGGHFHKQTFTFDTIGSLTGRTLYALGGIEQEHVKDAQGVWQVERTRISIQGPGGALGMTEHNAQATAASDHQRYFFHLDQLGSVCAITKAGAADIVRMKYEEVKAKTWLVIDLCCMATETVAPLSRQGGRVFDTVVAVEPGGPRLVAD